MEDRFKQHPNPNNDNDFDLDAYIAEQAGSQQTQQDPAPKEEMVENRRRSLGVLLIAMTLMFLWYHDWSPKEAYASIFGSSEPQVTVVADAPTLVMEATVADQIRAAREQARAARILQQENLERINQMQAQGATEQQIAAAEAAIERAMEALRSLEAQQNQDQLATTLGSDAFNFDFDFGDFDFQFEFGPDGQSFTDYREDLGVGEDATPEELEDLTALYFSKVPADFVKEQREKNPDITTEEILDAFNDQN